MAGAVFQVLLGSSSAPIELVFQAEYSGALSWTVNLGAPAPGRIIVVNTSAGATSATLGGNPMTRVVLAGGSAIYVLGVPSGTTATLTVVGGASANAGVYAMYNAKSATPTATASAAGFTTTINCNAGGAIITACNSNNTITGSVGVNQDWIGSPAFDNGGSKIFSTTQTGLTVGITGIGGAGFTHVAAAAFGPY